MFLLSAAFLFIVGTGGAISLKMVSSRYEHIAKVNLKAVDWLGDMDANVKYMFARILQITLVGNTPEEQEKLQKQILENKGAYQTAEAQFATIVQGEDEEVKLLATLQEKWKALSDFFDKTLPLAPSTSPQDRQKFADEYRGEFKKARHEFAHALDALTDYHNKQAETWVASAQKTARNANIITLLLAIIGFVSSLVMGELFTRGLSQSFAGTTESLQKGADQVGSSSREVFASSESLASSVTEQAAALQQTSSAVEELSAMVARNAESAAKSRNVSAASSQAAQQGKQAVEETVRAIGEIDKSNGEISLEIETNNREINNIVKVIAEIGDKTKVINDIVFQTKLLSFNASVEAARAGEQGKGFAVVAEEVGNLAQMSGNAAKEITDMLAEGIRKVEAIVQQTSARVQQLIAQGKDKVAHGVSVVQKTGQVLDEVVDNVAKVDNLINEISSASNEQDTGLREIVKAVNELEKSNQLNSSASSQTAKASLALSNQAEGLRSVVGQLLSTIEGGTRTAVEQTIDFDSAISAHIDWKMKLSNYIAHCDHSLDPSVVGADNKCALGKWVYGPGAEHSAHSEFQNMKTEHAAFHRCAGEIVACANQGDLTRAEKLMQPGAEYLRVSEVCVHWIKEMKAKVS